MQHAKITYTEDGTPKSVEFDDIYFSQGQGDAESQYVFIDQNDLPRRFRELTPGQSFTIAETGFGTGLNFLLAWDNFRRHAPEGCFLNFVSCEKYPLDHNALTSALRHFPQIAELATALADQYPPALQGYHALEFGSVRLVLMFDDASEAYKELTARVDAWFLDGFAPSRNPGMWQPQLFRQMQRLSHSQTTVATFTAARLVRDGLQGAGFTLQKVPGFGRKREMCRGRFIGQHGPMPRTAWPSTELPLPSPLPGRNVAVIGTGVAGITTAVELKKRGYQVTLYERHQKPAEGGSGNVQGAVYAKLSADGNPSTQFYAQALILAQRLLAQLPNDVAHDNCGLVQLVHNDRERVRMQAIADSGFIPSTLAQVLTAEALSDKLGVQVNDPGVWFEGGGWLAPRQLIQYLITQHDLTCHYEQQIVNLLYTDGRWQLTNQHGQYFNADQVVICSATDAKLFEQCQHLPLKPVAGQVTQLAADEQNSALTAVVCTDRYVMPVLSGQLTIGSTFRIKNPHTDVTDNDHAENIDSLRQRLPGLLGERVKVKNGRAAVRCTSPDYLPLVGPLADPEYMADHYALAIQRNLCHTMPAVQQRPGLWINVAHGSKGLCSSHLSARVLSAMIAGDPVPLQASLLKQLNPNRFIVRNLLRAKREKK